MPPHMKNTTMNRQEGRSCPAHHYSVDPGEATTGCDGGFDGFLGMFGDRASSGDLFDLVWQGRARGGSSMDVHPTGHLPSSPAAVALPSSENDMAAQLYQMVRNDELYGSTGQDVAPVKEAASDHNREEKLPKTEEKCCAQDSSSERRMKARKSHHHAEAHSLTEKRRRCRINEKLKALQQLVPGCDKSNQVSTLNKTIQYVKSLQQQIQTMSFGCGVNSAAVYNVMPPQYLAAAAGTAAAAGRLPPAATSAPEVVVRGHIRPGVVLAPLPPAMVPFGPLLPLVHASAPMLQPAPDCSGASKWEGQPAASNYRLKECLSEFGYIL